MSLENLYMFAIVPPGDLSKKIDDLKKQFASNFDTLKALKVPVHITLYPPFKATADMEEKVKQLEPWTINQDIFELYLKNFDFFENKKNSVVFINIEKSKELTVLHANFTKQLKKLLPFLHDPKTKTTFHPHITIAYRDVPPEKMPEIKRMYINRIFEASFIVDTIYLWKHNGKYWETITSFKMKSAPNNISDAQGSLF